MHDLVIRGGSVVDGTGAPARADQTVIVRDGKIVSVSDASSAQIPAGARVVDLTGKSLIPGLVLVHEHLYYPTGPGVYGNLSESFTRDEMKRVDLPFRQFRGVIANVVVPLVGAEDECRRQPSRGFGIADPAEVHFDPEPRQPMTFEIIASNEIKIAVVTRFSLNNCRLRRAPMAKKK